MRASTRRKRLGWRVKLARERVALRLAPWLEPRAVAERRENPMFVFDHVTGDVRQVETDMLNGVSFTYNGEPL